MAGHSHWKQIKTKKATSDQKKGALFSKLLNAIAIAARSEPNPQFNPRLRTTIEKAKEHGVPQENIERAVKRAQAVSEELQELILEVYGPGGAALIIQAITNNKNRTVQEIKTILKEWQGRLAEPGGAAWAFEKQIDSSEWKAKFYHDLSPAEKERLQNLAKALEEHDDVQSVFNNIK